MKTVFLLRHAKSAHDVVGQDDHDRGLTSRGQAAARAIGRHLAAGPVPQLVLCSTAVRTRLTLALVELELPSQPDVRFVPGLYLASASEILAAIQAVDDSLERLMVLGHNDGMQECARRLAGEGPDELHRRLIQQPFPTGGLARIEVDVPRWSGLADGTGRLVDLVFPRDL